MAHPTDDRAFRLPPEVRPTGVEATLRVDLAGRAFSGELALGLRLGRAVEEIVLHAAELEIDSVALTSGGRRREPVERRLVPASETGTPRGAERVDIAVDRPLGDLKLLRQPRRGHPPAGLQEHEQG